MISSDIAHIALSCLKILVFVGLGVFSIIGVRKELLALQEGPAFS